MKVAIYLRCSTDDQNLDAQRTDLENWAKSAGHEIVAVYEDQAISGTASLKKRPRFNEMLKDARKRTRGFQLIAVWTVCRLGRSTAQVSRAMLELKELGIDVFALKKGVDTTTSSGKLMINILSAMAEWERDLISERTKAGLRTAVSKGIKLGAPYASVTPVGKRCDNHIRDMLRREMPIREIKARLRVSSQRVYRVKNGIAA